MLEQTVKLTGEQTIIEARRHWIDWFWAIILAALTLPTVVFPFLVLGLKLWAWRNRRLVVTARRVLITEGMISRAQRECPVAQVNEVGFSQGVFGRMLGYGVIELRTASGLFVFGPVGAPDQVRDQIASAVDSYRREEANTNTRRLSDQIGQAVAVANLHTNQGSQ